MVEPGQEIYGPHPRPEPVMRRRRRTEGLSLVWLVPLIALLVSIWVAWTSFNERGPLIEIIFNDAGGIEEGKTLVKHRDVKVGVVEKVGFTEDGAYVRVEARIDKPLARFLDEKAQFWVVEPEVTVDGIRGLDTVLSGSFIEAAWDLDIGTPQTRFMALEAPPLTPPDQPGRRIRLIAQDGGSMSVGAPVFYKRIEVGRIESKNLTPDGEAVVFDIFVEAPHHVRLASGSRFWSTSGFDVEIGTDGAKVHVESLVSILRGGIAFDSVAIGGPPVQDNQLFRLFETEQAARASIFEDSFGAQIRMSVEFGGSVRGLTAGAPVELRGYKVGEVVDVVANVGDPENPEISLITDILIQPSRLGLPADQPEQALEFLNDRVERGLRAKLANASFITGALYVELVDEPDAPFAEIDEDAVPYPRLPSVASDFEDIAATAEGVMNRINNLPIEELLASANTLLVSLNTIATDETTQAVPGEVNALLSEFRNLVANPVLFDAVQDAADTLAAVETVAIALSDGALIGELNAALKSARTTTDNFAIASAAVPALVANLASVSGSVNELPLEELIISATGVTQEARAFFASENTKALPADLSRALSEVERLLADLREADAALTLATALEDAGAAAAAVREATANAPAMMDSIRAAADGAAAVTADLPDTLQSFRTAADSAQATLEEAPLALASIRALTDSAQLTFEEAPSAVASFRALADAAQLTLEETPSAIASFRDLAEGAQASLEEAPSTLASIRELAQGAQAGLEQAPSTLASIRELAQGAQASLEQAPSTLASIRALADSAQLTLEQTPSAIASFRDLADSAQLTLEQTPSAIASIRDLAIAAQATFDQTPSTLASIRALTDSAQLTLEQTPSAVSSIRALADSAQATFEQTPSTLSSIRALTDSAQLTLEQTPSAVSSIRALADSAQATFEQTPSTLSSLRGLADSAKLVADKAGALPLEGLVAEARGLLVRLDGLAGSDETRAVPASLNAALISVRSLVDELSTAQTAQRLAAVLDEAARTAQAISATSAEVPQTLRAVEALSNRISSLPLDQLVISARTLLDDIDGIVTSPGAEQIPGALVTSLDEIRSIVARLTELQVPENFNTSLVSFDIASRSFDVLSADLIAVLPVVQQVAGRADTVLSSLDVGSELNFEAVTMIREIRDAARAITTLAATVERKPDSLLFGK